VGFREKSKTGEQRPDQLKITNCDFKISPLNSIHEGALDFFEYYNAEEKQHGSITPAN
jgi:hypothetical protein